MNLNISKVILMIGISIGLHCLKGGATAFAQTTQSGKTVFLKLKLENQGPVKVEKSPLKYNKHAAFSLTLDDGYRSAFLCAYPLLNGGKVSGPFVDGWGKDQGGDGTASAGLYYTDGCGNLLPFRLGLAINASSFNDVRPERGNLSWEEVKTFYNAGWDIMNHSFHHATNHGTNYESEVAENNKAIAEKLGFEMTQFAVPGGEGDPDYADEYAKAAFKNGQFAVATTSGNGVGPLLPVSQAMHLDQMVFNRSFVKSDSADTGLINRHLHYIDSLLKQPEPVWYNEITHGVGNDNLWGISLTFADFKHYMTGLEDRHGIKGDDRLWMAPWQEVYEYIWLRDRTMISTVKKGKELTIQIIFPEIPANFRNRSLSLNVSTLTSFKLISQSPGLKVKSNGPGKHNLINIQLQNPL